MKTIITTFFLMVFTIAFSQKEVGYFIKDDNSTKVKIYSKLLTLRQNIFSVKTTEYEDFPTLSAETLMYYEKNGNKKYINQKSIKELYTAESKFIKLPIHARGNMPRLHRIIAYNDDYLFTTYKSNGTVIYYVFTKNGEFRESIWCVSNKNYGKDDDVIKKFMTTFDTYFSNCPKLKEILNSELTSYPKSKNGPFIVLFGATENVKLECDS